MTEYALRLANSQDTAARVRSGDALGLTASTALRARGGVRAGSGGAVTVNNGTMTVSVAPFMCWVDATISNQVGYPFVCDASKTLTIAAGHATLARTDVIAVVIRENAFDGGGVTTATLEVVQGTAGAGVPSLPAAAIPLRNISVPAGTSAGTGGLTGANLSTDRRQYVVGLGGILPVANQTERDALATYAGLTVRRADTGLTEMWDGTAWAGVRSKQPVCSIRATVVQSPTMGNGAAGTVQFDTTLVDTASMADLANERITIQKDGIYRLHGQIAYAAGASVGVGYRRARLMVNGASVRGNALDASGVTSLPTLVEVEHTLALTAGQQITLEYFHTYSAALNSVADTDTYYSSLSATWVSSN